MSGEKLRIYDRTGKAVEDDSLLSCLQKGYEPEDVEIFSGSRWKPCIISIVGAGGKSSLFYSLSRSMAEDGLNHALMTSAHMWYPEGQAVYNKPEDVKLLGQMRPGSGLWFGRRDVNNEHKLAPPSGEVIHELFTYGSPVLVEADGAKGKSCKVPAAWEPVILPGTTWVIAVLGMETLGRTIEDSCYRPKECAAFLNTDINHRMTPEDIVTIASSPGGMLKKVEDSMKYTVVLNQADNERLRQTGSRMAEKLEALGIDVWMTTYREER